jgi:hypothetical protein
MTERILDEPRIRRLIDAGRALIAKLDVEAVLQQLERFVTAGIDPETHRAIGNLPTGQGIQRQRCGELLMWLAARERRLTACRTATTNRAT